MILWAAVLIAGSLFTSCNNTEKNKQDNDSVSPELVTNPITATGKTIKSDLPVMEFETDKHDFGLIVQGEKVAYTFKFKNVGGSNLIISDASSTCGCTVPKWPTEPIKPGESSKVEVVFDSTNKTGANHKQVKLLTNAQPNTIILSITAEVFVPEK